MNTKRLSALTALILCIFMTAGCSGGTEKASGGNSVSSGEAASDASENEAEYTLKDAVILDTDLYTITANQVSSNEEDDCIVEFTIDNKSEYDLAFDFGDVCLNGFSAYGSWNEESENLAYPDPESTIGMIAEAAGDDAPLGLGVAAGGSTTETAVFTLHEHNMPVIDEILLTPDIYYQHAQDNPYDRGDNALSPEERELIANPAECGIYPTGLTADTVEYPEHQDVDGEQVIVDNDDFTYIIQELREENDGDTFRIWTYIENKTDKTLEFSWPASQVDGAAADLNQYGTSVAPGKRAYSAELIMKDYDEFFPEDGTIETISFNLLVEEERSSTDLSDDSTPFYEGSFTCSFEK